MDLDLVKMEEAVFGGRGSTQGRTARPDLEVSVARPLTAADIPALERGTALVQGAKPTGPSQLKSAHHQVARLIAEGRELVEIALITGYTPQYVHSLKEGQDFQELIKFYGTQRELIFVDTLERMKTLGITTLERLQVQLEDETVVWTKRELMEMAELMLLKPQAVAQKNGGGGATGTPGVVVNVKFVSAGATEALLDITPAEVEGNGTE
jgi:hypothetical protein